MLANFKAALAARRVKQIDLALQLKIDPTFLSRVINRRCEADPALRARIATALEVEETWLFQTATRIPRTARSVPVGDSSLAPVPAQCADSDE